MPNSLISILRQKSSSLRIVAKATSWGVVIRTAPFGLTFFNALTTVRCSSDVPGGVSEGNKMLDLPKERRVRNGLLPNTSLCHTHLAGEIQKGNNYRLFWICVGEKLGQGNHLIIVISFSKSWIFKIFSVHTKTQSRRFKILTVWNEFSRTPFSCWISVNGRPNRRNKAAISNLSGCSLHGALNSGSSGLGPINGRNIAQ